MPLVEITLVEGRPAEARASMMKRITDVIEQTLGAPRQSIRVILYEVPAFTSRGAVNRKVRPRRRAINKSCTASYIMEEARRQCDGPLFGAPAKTLLASDFSSLFRPAC